MKKEKFVKNPARNIPDKVGQYVPQYRLMGIEPAEFSSPPAPNAIVISKGAPENPRLPRPAIRQPYAETTSATIGKSPLPNVGNNVEHTWSSLDGEIIDDVSEELDLETPMIDNNEFVAPILEETEEVQSELTEGDFSQFAEMMQGVEDNEHLLLVKGIAISKGSVMEIEPLVQDLLFGTHEICDGQPFAIEDVLVVRKMPIRVGIFLG